MGQQFQGGQWWSTTRISDQENFRPQLAERPHRRQADDGSGEGMWLDDDPSESPLIVLPHPALVAALQWLSSVPVPEGTHHHRGLQAGNCKCKEEKPSFLF